jgi:hypothetical protein
MMTEPEAPDAHVAPDATEPPRANESPQGPTAAQLRRFIKSRPYVPLHELRRRFELIGELDDVTAVNVPEGRVFVGLPAREAEFLASLVREGDIGLELSQDPQVAIVVGVFPMRPVTRT